MLESGVFLVARQNARMDRSRTPRGRGSRILAVHPGVSAEGLWHKDTSLIAWVLFYFEWYVRLGGCYVDGGRLVGLQIVKDLVRVWQVIVDSQSITPVRAWSV